MAVKQCTKCKVEKDFEAFTRSKYSSDGRQSWCRVCVRIGQKAYIEANPELIKAKRKAWYEKNKERILPKLRESNKRYRTLNREKFNQQGRNWYYKNQDRKKAQNAEWHAANYETKRKPLMVNNERNSRARKRLSGGSHTVEEIQALYARQNARCVYCNASLKDGYHADHVMPLILGGSNDIKNIQLLCPDCNRSKGGKHPADFAQSRGLLI